MTVLVRKGWDPDCHINEVNMANEENLTKMGKARGLTTEEAQRIGRLGGQKKGQNNKERKLIKEMLEDKLKAKGYEDLDEALEKFIERMKEKDDSLKLGLQILGEDPGETINVGQTEPFKIEVEIERG